jgi:hypothetical protein
LALSRWSLAVGLGCAAAAALSGSSAPGDRLGPGAGSRAGGGLGVAVAPQVVVEGVKDTSVDRVQALAAQGGLDLLGDQAAVVLHRVRRDGLVAGDATLDPQVNQLAEGLEPCPGVLPVRHLGAQAGLHLLGLAAAAVDLAGELPLLAGQRVKAGVDDDLLAVAALQDGHSAPPIEGRSLTSR